MTDQAGVSESGFPHQGQKRLRRVASQALALVEHVGDQAVQVSVRTAKIKQVQGATWPEHAPYFLQASLLLVLCEVVEHEGGENSVV